MQTDNSIVRYYCCPERYFHIVRDTKPSSLGYFAFGSNTACYGHYSGPCVQSTPSGNLNDALEETTSADGKVYLPFDPDEIVDNLRRELYVDQCLTGNSSFFADLYYFARPVLPVKLRKRLQQLHFRGRGQLPFPRWPIDSSVDNIFDHLMLLALRAGGGKRIPFIWFWPDKKTSCAVITHDVESARGRNFCSALMDIDDAHGIKSSFQVIPEGHYHVSEEFLESIRKRGFEIAVHDLNHDGHLYRDHDQFLRRVKKINAYINQFKTEGFRSGALYRNQQWYSALKCSYDMSVPNTARFDPQSGGCCTVMPYFVGDVLEIPVTTIQDYTLFHILNDYSINIWKHQTEQIMMKHGLMSFIVHPDYIIHARARRGYESLLGYLDNLRQTRGVWMATPGEVNRWWRQRVAMTLVEIDGKWKIQGEGSERASVAYASEEDGKLSFAITDSSQEIPVGKESANVSLRQYPCTTK